MSNCPRCNAPIIWAITEFGIAISVDRAPVPDGNLILGAFLTGPHKGKASVAVAGNGVPQGKRWRSHFAVCPRRGR